MGEHDASLDARVVVEMSAWNELEKLKEAVREAQGESNKEPKRKVVPIPN